MSTENLQTVWSALLFASLADAGVRDVVISPGSRSTPLVIAAVRERRLTRHEAIDERAAAFFALGQARVTGRPTVLVCTSGTALAHYLPAIIEANLTATPIVVLSADRPHDLHDCSAPQTIDQVKIFGAQARHFFDLVPDGSASALRALRRVAMQAVLASTWPLGGAVHLNARARKPLEPVDAKSPDEQALADRGRAVAAEPAVVTGAPRSTAPSEVVAAAVAILRAARRGLIIAGPAAVSQRAARDVIWQLARVTGFAVVCEAPSQLRFCPKAEGVLVLDAFDLLVGSPSFRASAPFDVVIQLGAPPTSGPWEQIAPSMTRVVLAERGWPDPQGTASVMMFGDLALGAAALVDGLRGEPPPVHAAFGEGLRALGTAAWHAADVELAATPRLVEAEALRALVEKAPDRSLLVVGNSLAVRLVDTYQRAVDRDLDVLSQRGASGIDGLVAGAAGAATAAGRPLALALGDVSLLHDLASLGLAARVRTPLIVFVLHNGGGRIFEQLPLVDVPGIEPAIVEHATTPHDTDFAPAAALYGLRYARATVLAEVNAALDAAYAHQGATLIEVRVEASGAIALARRVRAAVEDVIAKECRRGSPP